MAFPADTTPIPATPDGADTLGGSTPTHTEHHDALADGLSAVFVELGANPSGSEADVAARLTAIEAENTAQGVDLTAAEGDIAALQSDVAALSPATNLFDAVAYGAEVDGTTDDTAAWQAAIDACAAAGGGIVTSSRAGVSIIAGAFQDTGGANAQLVLPDVHALDDEQMGIEIRGPWAQSACNSVVGATPVPDTGLVLKSTLTTGTGAVVGAYGSGTSYQHFTFISLTMVNLTIRTIPNPTITALDLRKVNQFEWDNLIVDTGAYSSGALAEPTTTTSYGVRFPAINNGALVVGGKLSVFGFYNLVEFSEHFHAEELAVGGGINAMIATAANHASRIERVLVGYVKYGLKFTGAHALDIDQWACEHATSGWYQRVYDIEDPSNYGSGFIRWWAVEQGTGPHNSFTKNGGSGVTTSRVGDALGSGGSTVYTHRDRVTASAGNTTLTLGATPVANTPHVWVNGTIKWPSTDYTISGAVITFVSAMSGSEVVTVSYQSLSSSYVAASFSTVVNIVDNFNRADSSSALGSTSTGSKAWTQHSGTWGIASNKAYLSNGVAAQTCLATVDADSPNVTISATVTTTGGAATCGIVCRADSAGTSNYVVEISVGGAYTPKIYKGTAGSYSAIATGASTTVASGSVISVELVGNTITVKDDGVTIVSVTDSTYSSQDRHGMYIPAPSGSSSTARFDDFTITG